MMIFQTGDKVARKSIASEVGVVLEGPIERRGQISEAPHLSEQNKLMVIAEGLAQKIIDIPDYEIVTEPLFVRPPISRRDYFADHWW